MNKKEYYKLFWEYLKRSENYKDYCNWKRQVKGSPEISLPQKIRKFKLHFEPLYNLFSDIHSEGFEKWWESNQNLFEPEKRTRVRDFKKIIGSMLDSQPSAQHVKRYFVNYLNSAQERALIEIDLWGQETSKVLGEQVGKIISALRQNEKVKAYSRLFNFLHWQPTSGKIKKPQSHLRYLEIYDMKHPPSGRKGLTLREIAAKIYPEAQEEKDKLILNPELLIHQVLNLAKKNIKNVERGRFPGDFENNRKIKPSHLSPK